MDKGQTAFYQVAARILLLKSCLDGVLSFAETRLLIRTGRLKISTEQNCATLNSERGVEKRLGASFRIKTF